MQLLWEKEKVATAYFTIGINLRFRHTNPVTGFCFLTNLLKVLKAVHSGGMAYDPPLLHFFGNYTVDVK